VGCGCGGLFGFFVVGFVRLGFVHDKNEILALRLHHRIERKRGGLEG
jgi:hypothetical protein